MRGAVVQQRTRVCGALLDSKSALMPVAAFGGATFLQCDGNKPLSADLQMSKPAEERKNRPSPDRYGSGASRDQNQSTQPTTFLNYGCIRKRENHWTPVAPVGPTQFLTR